MRKGELRDIIFVTLLVVVFTLAVISLLKSAIEVGDEKNEDLSKTITIQSEPSPPSDATIVEAVEIDPAYECLALNIYYESRSDNLAGRAAVADVVLNRVADDFYPDDVCSVVKQTVWIENWKGNIVPKRNMCQFSWFCDGRSDEPRNAEAYLDAYELAQQVLEDGLYLGITEGATHYHAPYVRPKWVSDRGMNYVGAIGAHEFYRWER